jgi:hypothetical protein
MGLPAEQGQVPDRWVIIKVTKHDENKTERYVLSGWYGGYLGGDSWRKSSNIVKEEVLDDRGNIKVTTESGSTYLLKKLCWGTSGVSGNILSNWQTQAIESEGNFTIVIEEEPK